MDIKIEDVVVLPELADFLKALPPDKFAELEQLCLSEGIRDALIVWFYQGNYVLVDGHNRRKIARKKKKICETDRNEKQW